MFCVLIGRYKSESITEEVMGEKLLSAKRRLLVVSDNDCVCLAFFCSFFFSFSFCIVKQTRSVAEATEL